MKKLSLFLATLAVSASAMAQGYTSFEVNNEKNRATDATNLKGAVVVGTKFGATDYSFKLENSQAELGSGAISQAFEVRAKQTMGAFYLGGRLGESVNSSTHFTYYAADAGLKFPLVAGLTADVGAGYRNAFKTANNFETSSIHGEVGYNVTKKDNLAVRWTRSYGDEEKDAWRLQYTRSF